MKNSSSTSLIGSQFRLSIISLKFSKEEDLLFLTLLKSGDTKLGCVGEATDETIELLPENDMQVHNWVRVVQAVHMSQSKEFVEKSIAQSEAAGGKLEYVWLQDLPALSGDGHVYFRLKYGKDP